MIKNIIAVLAALVTIAITLPYLYDIVRKRTKPNIVTWFTWTLLTAIATAAGFAAHQPQSALLTLATTIATGLVAVFGLRYGIAKLTVFDGLCQFAAVLGLIGWLIFNSPTIGILVPIAIDFIGAVPTYRHAWRAPGEETKVTYLGAALAAVLTIVSLPKSRSVGLLYPLYLFTSDFYIAIVVIIRERTLRING